MAWSVQSVASLPVVFSFEVARGFSKPVDIQSIPGDGERLFVVEQAGLIWILEDGVKLEPAFLDIQHLVSTERNEQGLLGLAFSRHFDEDGFFYVYYSIPGGDSLIERYSVGENANLADNASGYAILEIPQPAGNHNGGQIQFGPDGYLYIGTGDGGGGGDPFGSNPDQGNAQDLNTLLGKMLRIDVKGDDFPLESARNYRIPVDNPFLDQAEVRPEIWSLGLRNPWRFSFDSATGDLYIADVGQNDWEEISVQSAESEGGDNYGWRRFEGESVFRSITTLGAGTHASPVWVYGHGDGRSITGGYVYRGERFPVMSGIYYFGDYVTGRLWGLTRDGLNQWISELALSLGGNVSTFGCDAAGEIYWANHTNGRIYRLQADRDRNFLEVTRRTLSANGNLAIEMGTSLGDTFQFRRSPNLVDWQDVGSAISVSEGEDDYLALFEDSSGDLLDEAHFFRVEKD